MMLTQAGAVSASVLARGPATDGSEAFQVIAAGGLWFTGAYLLVLLWLLDRYARMTPGPHRDRRTRGIWRAFPFWACRLLGASTFTVCSTRMGWPTAVALLVGVGVGLALPMPGRRQHVQTGSRSAR